MNTNKREKRGKPVYTKQQQKLIKMGVRPGSREFGAVKMQAAPKPMRKFNLGGEAATSVGRGTVVKSQREAQRKKLDDMMKRLYGPTSKPKPKPKPKKPLKKVLGDKIRPKKKPLKKRYKGAQMLGLAVRGAGIAIKGLGKAFKAYKRANRRQSLGLPRETNMQRMKRIKKAGQKRADKRKGTR